MWGCQNTVAKLLATSLFCVAVVVTLHSSPAHALRAGSWSWPLTGAHTISRGYEAPDVFYGPGHRGVDLVALPGQEVFAPADGVVHFVGNVVDRELMSLEHGEFLSTFEPVMSTLVEGDVVTRGQVIGTVSTSTHCTCLHMGARQGKDYLSPLAFLTTIPAAVLLPWD